MSLANFFARYSVTRYNKIRPLRLLSRKAYQLLSTLYCWFSPKHHHDLALIKRGEILDTYPYPYSDPFFANWPESDDDNNYSLVPDPSGCVVKYCTSYCAYKIYETVGKWPKRTSKRRRFDAKDWREFLSEAGYWEVDYRPSKNFYYVGVRTHPYRTYGEVVWLERYEGEGNSNDIVLVTTYDHKMFVSKLVRVPDYTWVKIARREPPLPVDKLANNPPRPAFS